MTERKKIAIFIPHLKTGGTEKVAATLSKSLSEYHDVSLLLYEDKCDFDCVGEKTVLSFKNKPGLLGKIMSFCSRINIIKDVKRKIEADTTVSFFTHTNIYNVLSRVNDRIILTIHSRNIADTNFLTSLFIRHFYRKADAIVTVSTGIKNIIISMYGIPEEKIKVIYNPLDISEINSLKELPLDEKHQHFFMNGPVIISVGRFSWEKAQWRLLKVLKYLCVNGVDANVLFVGFDEYTHKNESLFQDFMRLIDELDITDKVFFAGKQPNPFNLIASSTVLALSSVYEGFGLALAESMACGTPVVSVDCDFGPREIIAPGTVKTKPLSGIEVAEYGILTPAMPYRNSCNIEFEEPEIRMAEAVKMLINDKELHRKFSEKGLKRASDFDKSKIIKQYLDIL
jgi:glycosyltransferase involved in cell wall biosynthesis